MFLLSDTDAALWLLTDIVIALVLAYTVLFWVYHRLCSLDPSRAIRMALTVSLLGLVLYVSAISSHHAPYMAFWNDLSLLVNFLIVAAPAVIIIALIWATQPGEKAR